jgi:hypothetical protein
VIKKFIALTAIAALFVSLAAVAGAKPQVKKVKTTVTLSFTNGNTTYTPYTQDKFSGQVKAKKGCKKKRTIVINKDGVPTALTTTSDSSGDFSVSAGDAAPGTYTATAKKKNRKTNNGTKIICKKGTSNAVVVP